LLVVTLIGVVAIGAHPDHDERPTGGRIETVSSAPDDPSSGLLRAQAYYEQQVAEVAEYLTTLDAVGDYVVVEEFLASLYVAPVPEPAVASTSSTSTSAPSTGGGEVGECTGFAIPDYIIQRESGGSSTAANPSGAYGCAQTLLSHYSGGSCGGLDPYTIQGQRDCVNILSSGGTNLAPWAETR
jgi:PKD repeat protein